MGGFVTVEQDDEKFLRDGDPEALKKAIGENGFTVWGKSYISGESVDFRPEEEIKLICEKKDTLSVSELENYLRLGSTMYRKCHEQFLDTAKSYIAEHPDLKDHKIWFDPDSTFTGELDHKHGTTQVGDILAVGFDENGKILFDISAEYDLLRNEHSISDCCYGVYIEDWAFALKVLLEHIDEPYEPEDDEPYED